MNALKIARAGIAQRDHELQKARADGMLYVLEKWRDKPGSFWEQSEIEAEARALLQPPVVAGPNERVHEQD